MRPVQYLLSAIACVILAAWTSHAYLTSVVDAEVLAYGQSVLAPGGTAGPRIPPRRSLPSENDALNQEGITLERTMCYGACPMYWLYITPSGTVHFRQGPPPRRFEERQG